MNIKWCGHCKAMRSWHHFSSALKVFVCDTCKRDQGGNATDVDVAQAVSDAIEEQRIIEGDPTAPKPQGLIDAPKL